jgi:hypothetical protein
MLKLRDCSHHFHFHVVILNITILISRIYQIKVSSCIMTFNFHFIARYWNNTLNKQCCSLDSSLAVTSLHTCSVGLPSVYIARVLSCCTIQSHGVTLSAYPSRCCWVMASERLSCLLYPLGRSLQYGNHITRNFSHVFSQPVVDAGIIHLPVFLFFLQDTPTCAFRKFELWNLCSFLILYAA